MVLTSHLYFSLIVANHSYTSVSWVVLFEICSVIFVLSKHMFHSALIMCTVPILTTVSKIQTLSFLFSHFTLCETLGQFSFSTLMFLSALSVVYFVPNIWTCSSCFYLHIFILNMVTLTFHLLFFSSSFYLSLVNCRHFFHLVLDSFSSSAPPTHLSRSDTRLVEVYCVHVSVIPLRTLLSVL